MAGVILGVKPSQPGFNTSADTLKANGKRAAAAVFFSFSYLNQYPTCQSSRLSFGVSTHQVDTTSTIFSSNYKCKYTTLFRYFQKNVHFFCIVAIFSLDSVSFSLLTA